MSAERPRQSVSMEYIGVHRTGPLWFFGYGPVPQSLQACTGAGGAGGS